MYILAVKRDFIARHYLIGGDWGTENELHAHHYVVEVRLEGASLNEHQYLTDIVDIEEALEVLVARYRDQTLNELPEFERLNPSIELFARIMCKALVAHLTAPNLGAVTVQIWENDIAWASFRQELVKQG